MSLLVLGAIAIVGGLALGRLASAPGGAPGASASGIAAGAGGGSAGSGAGAGGGGASGGGGSAAGAGAGGSGAGAGAPAAGSGGPVRALPAGLDDRGWIAEVGVQRWLAGSLSGRVLLLPSDEIGLTATGSQVVSVRYGTGGRTSTVRVRDLAGGKLRASVDRPGTISSAIVAGGVVYVAGDAATGDGSDAGVQAISLVDGSVRDVIAPSAASGSLAQPITRAQLRIDPTGRYLGSALCSGETCTVDLVDLTTGARSTPLHGVSGFLVALTGRVLYVVGSDATSLDAFDAVSGAQLWHLDDLQVSGVRPSADGTRALVGYLPAGAGPGATFTLAAIDATTGNRRVVVQRSADTDVPTFYPDLSGDRFAVIGSGGTLGELLGGLRRHAALSIVDEQSGATQSDALSLDAP
jgi:hypothetical protein